MCRQVVEVVTHRNGCGQHQPPVLGSEKYGPGTEDPGYRASQKHAKPLLSGHKLIGEEKGRDVERNGQENRANRIKTPQGRQRIVLSRIAVAPSGKAVAEMAA